MVTSYGPLNCEVPTKVDTVPPEILRIAPLYMSATYNVPEASTVTPAGPLKFANATPPSPLPDAPFPAKVVTFPAASTFLIRLL